MCVNLIFYASRKSYGLEFMTGRQPNVPIVDGIKPLPKKINIQFNVHLV